jgi:hypothetical protein
VLKPRLADAQTGQALSAGSDPVLAPLEGLASPDDGPRLIVP